MTVTTYDDVVAAVGDDVPENEREQVIGKAWEAVLAGQNFRASHPDPAVRLADTPSLVRPPEGDDQTDESEPATVPAATPSGDFVPVRPIGV